MHSLFLDSSLELEYLGQRVFREEYGRGQNRPDKLCYDYKLVLDNGFFADR
jgi:hypothetical protein